MTSEQRLESLITRLGEKQGNKTLDSNLESLAQVVISEITEFKDKILRTICKWCVWVVI